jgi:predicted nucleic-acid-binding protein
MRAADTNVLVRVLTRDDEKQAAAADAFIAKGAWVSHFVLMETTWVLSELYELGHDGVATAVEMLLDHQHIALQDGDVVASALQRYRQKPSLGIADCLILEVARKAGHLPLGTFDKALSRLEGAERL